MTDAAISAQFGQLPNQPVFRSGKKSLSITYGSLLILSGAVGGTLGVLIVARTLFALPKDHFAFGAIIGMVIGSPIGFLVWIEWGNNKVSSWTGFFSAFISGIFYAGLIMLILQRNSVLQMSSVASFNSEPLETVREYPWVIDEKTKFTLYHTRDKSGKWGISFENAPPFVHRLDMAAQSWEEELNHGDWVVLVYATWSTPDTLAIRTAVNAVKKMNRNLQLGIRPFREYEETKIWYPGYKECTAETPIWLVVRNGKVLSQEHGLRSEKRIARMVEDAFSGTLTDDPEP